MFQGRINALTAKSGLRLMNVRRRLVVNWSPGRFESIQGGSMKWKKVLSAMFLGVLLFAGIAHAQYTPQVIKVNVPFSFEVNGRSFPAGSYSLVRSEPNLLRLRDSNGRWL